MMGIRFKMKFAPFAVAALLLASINALAQEASVPKHLELARELVTTVKPENNRYDINGGKGIRWKGDLFVSENYVDAGCVKFARQVLERARSKSIEELKAKTSSKSNLAISLDVDNFYTAILKEYGFTHLEQLSQAKPGDIFVFFCNNPSTCNNTSGHVTFIDMEPVPKTPTAPIIEGTKQWVLTIIDSAEYPHGIRDTRFTPPGTPKITGVGRGEYRVYTDLNDNPVGYTNGPNAPKFFSINDRPIVIGRPLN